MKYIATRKSIPFMQSAWQAELADSFTHPADLLDFLELDPSEIPLAPSAALGFPFLVTRSYAARMSKRDPRDPLLRQVLPLSVESLDTPGYTGDPVGDLQSMAGGGVLHKYQGRVLLLTTGACAIHCRYCFRREFPYQQHPLGKSKERESLEYIASDPSIHEVILSGGDPLVLNDTRLADLIEGIAFIPHVQRLRFHTRVPIVLPSRITPELVKNLSSIRLCVVVVIHANHPAELDPSVDCALKHLRMADVRLLNQAVLLKDVNDDLATLNRLSEALFEGGVLPYYLHLLDKARGTAHFEVEESTARRLLYQMRSSLPGYLVPKLVREIAGEACKRMIA